MLFVLDAGTQRQIEDYFYWIDGTEMKWEYLGEATGEVVVTRGKRVRLALNKTAGNDLGPLSNLAPDDLYGLRLGQTSDDGCLAHVTHLTGLRVLEFPRSYSDEVKLPVFTPGGLKQLDTLKSLERLSRAHNLSLVLKTLHDGEVDKAARELDRLLCWDILRAGADLASADARTRAWTGDMFRRIARTRPKTEEGAPDTVEARAPAQRILERASRAN